MSKLPFMPLYVSDYDAATTYLSLEEDGLYGRILRMMWATPNCSLPDDKDWLIKRLRITEQQYADVFLFIKKEYFKVSRGRIYQKRLQSEYVKANGIVKARSDAGKKGGRPKSLKIKEKDKSKGSVLSKQTESKPKASTVTSTVTVIEDKPPTPLKGDVEVITHRGRNLKGKKAEEFLLFWDTFSYKTGKAQAASSWRDISGYSDSILDDILLAAQKESARRPSLIAENKTPKMAQGWITARRWEDEFEKPKGRHSESPEDFGVDADAEITATITRVT